MYPYGYNLEEGGENYTRSEKTKQKMSDVMKGEKNPFYGKKHSEETRQEISKNHARFWKGKKRSAESRRKMAENNPMKCPETRRKHAEAMKVRTLSEESRQKIVDAKRSPSYALAYQAFCALPKTLTLPEIRKILIDQFQDVSKATVRRWTKNWYRDNAASELHPNLDAKRISGTPTSRYTSLSKGDVLIDLTTELPHAPWSIRSHTSPALTPHSLSRSTPPTSIGRRRCSLGPSRVSSITPTSS